MRLTLVLIVLFLCVPAAFTQSDFTPIAIPNTASMDVSSTSNGRDYRIWIALPANYDTSEQVYPVLYLLDPDVSFLTATEFVRYMGRDETFAQIIVVGIGYPTDNTRTIRGLRERDYFIESDYFLEFISDELMPLMDSTYRTDTTDRALAGFSYGAEFVFHVLVNDPARFNRYIAIEPLNQQLAGYLGENNFAFQRGFAGRETKLFIASVGTEVLSNQIKVKGLEVTGLSLGNVTHNQALHFSLPEGILAIYAD